MKKKIDLLDSELNSIVKKYENKAPNFEGDFKSTFDRFLHYNSIKTEFITELNLFINPFLLENEKEMSVSEKSYLNLMIKKHERNAIYGFSFPSDLEQ
tara:strand:+ start:173 stop:466 length:294 start_codon:yes stop_codon:yes gene_type:complete